MHGKLVFLFAFIAACASVLQVWFSISILLQSKTCRQIFAYQNTSNGNWHDCTQSLVLDSDYNVCTCEKQNEISYVRGFDDVTVILAIFGLAFVIALEVLRALVILLAAVCATNHDMLSVDSFSIAGTILLCLQSKARNNVYANLGTFVPFIDILMITLVIRYAAVTQKEHVFSPLATLLVSLFNIARGLTLNFEYCVFKRRRQQDEQAPLLKPS